MALGMKRALGIMVLARQSLGSSDVESAYHHIAIEQKDEGER